MKKNLSRNPNFFPETFPINDIIFKMKEFTTSVLTTYPTYPNYKLFDKYERKKYQLIFPDIKKRKLLESPSYPRKKIQQLISC